MKCSVPFCSSKSSDTSLAHGGLGVTFHEFPKDMRLRAAWLKALGKQDCQLPDSAVVCSQHFLHDDIYETEDGVRQLCTDAVPSAVLVCMTCLDTDSKMFSMNQHSLKGAYEQLTGYPPCDGGNLKLTLCVQCAEWLRGFTRFREQSLRARSLIMELLEKHELITLQQIKMIQHANNLLKNNLVSTMLGPNPCVMYIVDNPDEDRQTDSEETVLGVAVKTECSNDSQSVDGSTHLINEENSCADCVNEEFDEDPSKCGSAEFTCTVCFEQFPHEHAYSAHVHTHLRDQAPKSDHRTTTDLKSCVVKLYDILKYPENTKVRVESSSVSSHDIAHTACEDARVADTHNKPAASVLSETEPATSGSSSRTGSYSCDFCQRVYSQKHNLIAHRRTHTGEKPYSCQLCSYKCIQKGYLNRHMRAHTGEKPYSCKLCSYKFIQKSGLNRHMMGHTGEKPYSCNLCSYKCSRKCSLNRHMRAHTGEKPYCCKFCSHKSTVKSNLMSHMRTHTGENPYSCKLCSYKSVQQSSLVYHKKIHTGEKPYSCKLCSYKCTVRSSLNRHIRVHTGEKPYSCELCVFKCTEKGNLVSHMRTHTGEKPYSCEFCSYKCIVKRYLVSHMRVHAGEKPFSCGLCGYKCKQKVTFVGHMRTHTDK